MQKQYEIIWYNIGVESPIDPQSAMPSLPSIPRGALVAITGRSPIWRYGFAFHALHGSPAAAIACYDPRLGLVVVASHSPLFSEGEIIDAFPPE